jgi:RNA recognition motif-containing protein
MKLQFLSFVLNSQVQSCKLSLDEKGVSRGFGFVNMANAEEAAAACAALHEKVYMFLEVSSVTHHTYLDIHTTTQIHTNPHSRT